MTQRVTPVFRWGFIGPGRPGPVHVGAGYRFYQIVPTSVMLVSTGLVGLDDYTKAGVDRAIQSYWECVDLLAKQRVDVIILGGAPISAQLGPGAGAGAVRRDQEAHRDPGGRNAGVRDRRDEPPGHQAAEYRQPVGG